MKIQELAIIFIIIILPISLLLSEYTQFQIKTINLQTEYDSKLTTATYDAIKAYQLNSINESYSEIENENLRGLEASVSAFRNSLMTAFELNGYTKDELDNYIPALVYTLYDGFYIYSPYENTNYRYETNEDGTPITNKPIDDNGEKIYGLKPYIKYSCRYKTANIDVVITYALDNYVTVQGKIDDEYVNRSGYLIDNIDITSTNVIYNGVTIEKESLKENVLGQHCNYIKFNGTKYYLIENYYDGQTTKDVIAYISNGTLIIDNGKTNNINAWKSLMINNDSAIQYYKQANEFTEWFKSTELVNLTYADALDEVIKEDGTTDIVNIWESENTKKVFDFNQGTDAKDNIENETSEFNQHRLAIIRHKIETNLAIAISNYNQYSGAATSNVFQMPELKEDEWEQITHNISLISFLQGIHIGGKVYNGYAIVTNSESKEVVLEEHIYVLGYNVTNNSYNYHRVNDNCFIDGTVEVSDDIYGSAGRLNLDFKRNTLTKENVGTFYYYPLNTYNASYESVVMQNNVTTYDDIYEYINDCGNQELQKAFYIALGRERQARFNMNYDVDDVVMPYIPNGYTKVNNTDLNTGFVIQDSEGNQLVWVEVPRYIYTASTYNTETTTADRMPTSENDFDNIEYCLKAYTSNYSKEGYEDIWFSEYATGLTETEYNTQKKKMLKSIYKYGGFYVGRYETGTETYHDSRDGYLPKPIIKAGVEGYTNIEPLEAQELSSRFATTGYTSSLMFGVQWDLILRYFESKGANLDELITDSSDWGLYDEWFVTTGLKDEFSKQNIYDIAGNFREMTLEFSGDAEYPITWRGGCHMITGDVAPVCDRWERVAGVAGESNCFRVSLYTDEEIPTETATYTIIYDANGGSNTPTPQVVNEGATIQIPSNIIPNKEGYDFLGWSSGVTTYQPGDSITPTTNMILTAVWDIQKYNFTIDANGGTFVSGDTIISTEYEYGTMVSLSSLTSLSLRTGYGYTFIGWSLDADAETASYSTETTLRVTGNITLYAVWEYVGVSTIRYKPNGATGIERTQTVNNGDSVTLLSASTYIRTGYKLIGWSESSTSTTPQYLVGNQITVTRAMTLYAIWQATSTGGDYEITPVVPDLEGETM